MPTTLLSGAQNRSADQPPDKTGPPMTRKVGTTGEMVNRAGGTQHRILAVNQYQGLGLNRLPGRDTRHF